MKKFIAYLLTALFCFSLVPINVSASYVDMNTINQELAQRLKQLNLFQGVTDTDFALDRAPTRVEAVVMIIRLLGQESNALNTNDTHPFADVPAWADKYISYAYSQEITMGVSDTLFGSNTKATAQMYLTLILRAIGYSDKNGEDFTWDDPYTLAEEIGLMKAYPDLNNFLRRDVVRISYAALGARTKPVNNTIMSYGYKLVKNGVITAEQLREAYTSEIFEYCMPEPEPVAVNIDEYSNVCDAVEAYCRLNNRMFGNYGTIEIMHDNYGYDVKYEKQDKEISIATPNQRTDNGVENVSIHFWPKTKQVHLRYTYRTANTSGQTGPYIKIEEFDKNKIADYLKNDNSFGVTEEIINEATAKLTELIDIFNSGMTSVFNISDGTFMTKMGFNNI